MKLAILILNYNGQHLLPRCLNSVKNQTDKNFTVYLVENASTDNSITIAQKHYPQIKIIKKEKNAGFTGGYNYAFKYLDNIKQKYDYYFILSNDVFLGTDVIYQFKKVISKYPKTAIYTPTIVDNNSIIDVCGGKLSLLTGRCPGNQHNKKYQKKDILFKTFWACGAAFFINTNFLKKVDYFDDYFAYFEDISLGWKITNQKGLILSGLNCKALHLGSSTFKSSPHTFYLIERNRIYAFWQNLTTPVFWILIWPVILSRLLCLFGLIFLKRVKLESIKQALLGIKDGFLTKNKFKKHNNLLTNDIKALFGSFQVIRYYL